MLARRLQLWQYLVAFILFCTDDLTGKGNDTNNIYAYEKSLNNAIFVHITTKILKGNTHNGNREKTMIS